MNLLDEALQAHQLGDFKTAKALYQNLLNENPNNLQALQGLGILHAQEKQFDQAYLYIESALKLEANNASLWSNLGNIEKHRGNFEKATSAFQKALELMPNSASAHNNLGILYYQNQNYLLAESHFQKAIELKSDYADAYFNLSLIAQIKEDFTEAKKQLELAIKSDKSQAIYYRQLAEILLKENANEAAAALLQRALDYDSEDYLSHHFLAIAETEKQEIERAIVQYEKALNLNSRHAESWHNLGTLYLMQKKFDKAMVCYHQALEIKEDSDTLFNVGVISLYQDRYQDAIRFFENVLKLDANYSGIYQNLAVAYLRKQDYAKAIEYYEKALALNPKDEEIQYILSALKQKNDHYVAAPKQYIENLFDQYAPYFDTHLAQFLRYRVPEEIHLLLSPYLSKDKTVIDLGCGTGLCAEILHEKVKSIIGIDLSAKMIAEAKNKNIYQQLIQGDIVSSLKQCEAADIIIAGDVFTYIGDLSAIFSGVKSILNSKGLFAFTTEISSNGRYQLNPTMRYSHSANYIRELASSMFKILTLKEISLRHQHQEPIQGQLWLLQNAF